VSNKKVNEEKTNTNTKPSNPCTAAASRPLKKMQQTGDKSDVFQDRWR